MPMVWTPIATAMLLASSAATFLTMLHLRFRWDVHKASVRWLFWLFFFYVWSYSFMRAVYYLWLNFLPLKLFVDAEKRAAQANATGSGSDGHEWTNDKFDRLGIHAAVQLQQAKTPAMATVLVLGDIAICGVALTLFPLTYELWRLARNSMDRGVALEQAKIKVYAVGIHVTLAAFSITQITLVVIYDGYNVYAYRMLLAVYVVQFLGLAFMAVLLLRLKVNGRKYETIHGTFVASPVYQRLKRIMLVYALFSFQFQLSTFIVTLNDQQDATVVGSAGISLIIYSASGLALSITTSCSQACVFSTCSSCLPDDFEAEYLHRCCGGQGAAPEERDLEAPRNNPIFVYTDIESSSAMWAIQDGRIMDKATEIHDTILRTTLLKYHGYEITTVGDAFQVAFHTIRDAIEYCMDVQLQLMVAKWPKEVHGAIPATVKQRAGRRVVFNGLRVRMGIHDALDTDGTLVQDVHAVTGKTIYTGVSEVIAEFVGDLGCGGQILMTGRVAAWLKHHRDDLSIDVFMDRVGQYTVPQVKTEVELFHVLPAMLAARDHFFVLPEKGRLRQDTRSISRQGRFRRGTTFERTFTDEALVSSALSLYALLESAKDPVKA